MTHNVSPCRKPDLRASVKTLERVGDFSTIRLTMIGLGEPREFKLRRQWHLLRCDGLHPVSVVSSDRKTRGGPQSGRVVVLTVSFLDDHFEKDPSVIGKPSPGSLAIGLPLIGVLNPPFPYPQTPKSSPTSPPAASLPHHGHPTSPSQTELLAVSLPGVTLEQARAECAPSTEP